MVNIAPGLLAALNISYSLATDGTGNSSALSSVRPVRPLGSCLRKPAFGWSKATREDLLFRRHIGAPRLFGARGGSRTHTSSRIADFKSAASTSSATRAASGGLAYLTLRPVVMIGGSLRPRY